MFLIAVVLSIFLYATESYGVEEEIALYCVRGEDSEWSVHATEHLRSLAGGRVVALLLTLQISDGWHVDEAKAPDGLTVTVQKKQDGHVTVLLDGIVSDCESALLCVVLRSETDDAPAEVCVSEGAVLYILCEDGHVESRAIFAERDDSEQEISPETTIETETMQDPVLETEDETEPITDGNTDKESEKEFEEETSPPANNQPTRYMGCRESAVRDGMFAVQLLFEEEGGVLSAAVFVMGGGHSTLTSDRTEVNGESLCAMTYRGLSADRVYVFSVYTSDGVVEVVYCNGRFVGHREPQL